MKAEIICTGTELLLGQIVNTNARLFSRMLAEAGIDLYRITTVGDNRARIESAIRAAMADADLIILNGGLGPTEDDQTREALISVLGVSEDVHGPTLERIRVYGRNRNLPYLRNNDKVARVPAGAVVFANGVGSAPGSALHHAGKVYVLTPGPPHELEPLLFDEILPWLRTEFNLRDAIVSRVMKVAGIGESTAEERVRDLIASTNPTLAPTIKEGEIHFRISAKAGSREEAAAMLDRMETEFRNRLGHHVFGRDEETLEHAVGRLLLSRGLHVSCAESCTGGALCSALTDVPGSSGYLDLSVVTYSDEYKQRLLGVDPSILMKFGAVSAETVRAMAEGARTLSGADIGLSVSGIAGPDGGSLEKPVGLVWLGLCQGQTTRTHKLLLSGGRTRIKRLSVKHALYFLYDHLLDAEAKR